jgi:hypothetical protein
MLQEYEFSGFQGKQIPILSHCSPPPLVRVFNEDWDETEILYF